MQLSIMLIVIGRAGVWWGQQVSMCPSVVAAEGSATFDVVDILRNRH